MFENIIGQREITATLRAELTEGRYPRSTLYFGPAYCAKLSTALEVARVLTCREGRGEWSCECPSCRVQRELAHPAYGASRAPLLRRGDRRLRRRVSLRSRKPATQYPVPARGAKAHPQVRPGDSGHRGCAYEGGAGEGVPHRGAARRARARASRCRPSASWAISWSRLWPHASGSRRTRGETGPPSAR